MSESDANWRKIQGIVELSISNKSVSATHVEDSNEERPEVIKHLGEEIPPHADIGGKVRYAKSTVSMNLAG